MTDQPPNVLFLLTDDQRFDTIAAVSAAGSQTPHLDALVADGVVMTQAHIMGGSVAAVCMPSRAMLNTGRTLFHITDDGREIADGHTLLGEHFRAAGYQTFGAGKWHNGKRAYARSFTNGDEIFFGGMADHWNVPAHHFDPTGEYASTLAIVDQPMRDNQVRQRDGDHIHAGRHSTDILAQAACRFLEQRDRSRPFFSYVAFLAPHDPRTMPAQYLERHDREQVQLPPNFTGGHPFNNGELHVRDEKLAAFPRDPAEVRRHIAEYRAMITHLDDAIGRIIATLKETGSYENTIIVLAGDNGLAVGQHGLMGKQNLYDHSVRVPLVFAGPGVPRGQRREQMCYLIDIFPTLCDLCGLETPASVEGLSLAPAFADGSAQLRNVLLTAYRHLQRSARDDRYKLIEYVVDGQRTTQLFDLQDDPWEMRNLAGQPDLEPTQRRLAEELRGWREELDDPADSFWRVIADDVSDV